MSYQKTVESQGNTSRVLSDTFRLTSFSLIFAFLVQITSNMLGLTKYLDNVWITLSLFAVSLFLIFKVFKNANSSKGIIGIFMFSGVHGLMLDPLLSRAIDTSPGAIASAFATTATITLFLSFYARTTKRNFDGMGPYLIVALVALIAASIVNFLMGGQASYAISACASIIFSLFILYDVNQIVRGGENNYISASLSLFINILGLFTSLLNVFSDE